MKKIYIILFFTFLTSIYTVGCCHKITSKKSKDYNYLKKELGISNSNFKKIKGDQKIIEELKLAIKDSLIKKKASLILDSFFLKKENSKKRLLTILELNRIFKGSKYRIINDKDIDSNKALIINNIKDLQKLKNTMDSIKVKIKTDTIPP